MAPNKITIIVDGLRQVQALEKSLRNISRLADKVNGTGGGSKVNKTLQQETKIQRILNQIETKRNQILQLDVKNAKYISNGVDVELVKATIDGVDMFVPLDPANRHYAEIMRQVDAGELTIKDAD